MNPSILGHYKDERNPNAPRAVYVKGDFAYVADDYAGLEIIDVSDPNNFEFVARYKPNSGYPIYGVFVNGSYAYLLEGGLIPTLKIIDVSDPTNPTEVGVYFCKHYCSSFSDVYVSDSLVYLASGGLKILNLSDPSNPIEIEQFNWVRRPHDVVEDFIVESGFAYITSRRSGMVVIDVRDPTNLTKIGEFSDGGCILGISVVGNLVFLAACSHSLQIIDFEDFTAPIKVGQLDTGGFSLGVFVEGDFAYVADGSGGLEIIKIRNPRKPTEVGQFDDGGTANDVFVSGGYAFVADGDDGLEIINILDPRNPTKIAQFYDGGYARELFISDDFVFVADGDDGLEIIDVSILSSPVKVCQYNDGGEAWDVFVSGEFAFVADKEDGLEIINISDPTNLTKVAQYHSNDSFAEGIFIDGDYAYLTSRGKGLEILNISNPLLPTKVGEAAGGWRGGKLVVVEGFAYWTTGSSTPRYYDFQGFFEVYDVRNPTNPKLWGDCYHNYFYGVGSAIDVFISNDLVYIANGQGGLIILRREKKPFGIDMPWFIIPLGAIIALNILLTKVVALITLLTKISTNVKRKRVDE